MDERVIRVAWVAGEPTPYRVPQLQAIEVLPGIALSVVYATRTFQHRVWKVDHPGATFLRGPSLPTTRVLHHQYPITPGVWRFLGRGGFDLVVIAGWAFFAAQLAILWCRLHRVPYLLISENHLRESRRGWVRLLKRIVLPHVVPPAAGALVTGSLAKEHIAHYGARPDRIIVFPNTVDVSRLANRADELRRNREAIRRELGFDRDDIVVLQVGRLIEMKGPDLLVRAIARARTQLDGKLRLVLAGDGPLREDLEHLADRLGVELTSVGHVEGDDLISLYVAADIFALLSRREPWGVVVNEAISCALPIVLSEGVGAAADLLVDGHNGFQVSPDDEVGVAAAFGRLARDPDLRASFGAASRAIVGPWGYEPSVAAFERVARQVVGESSPACQDKVAE